MSHCHIFCMWRWIWASGERERVERWQTTQASLPIPRWLHSENAQSSALSLSPHAICLPVFLFKPLCIIHLHRSILWASSCQHFEIFSSALSSVTDKGNWWVDTGVMLDGHVLFASLYRIGTWEGKTNWAEPEDKLRTGWNQRSKIHLLWSLRNTEDKNKRACQQRVIECVSPLNFLADSLPVCFSFQVLL